MDKDPLERERRFRQSLEDHASARRRSQSRRRRPWLGWLESFGTFLAKRWGHLFMLFFPLALGGFFLFLFGFYIKWTDAYACSLAQARRSPAVLAEIGEPVAAGFFAWSSSSSGGGGVTTASFSTALKGPKGEGTLFVNWYSSPIGSSLQMELEKEGRKHRVYAGAAQCP